MNRYFDDEGKLVRVCNWCLEGVDTPKSYVYDPHFEDVQCIYCDSYNTVEDHGVFTCKECGQKFRRIV